jgi:hypothetical protein
MIEKAMELDEGTSDVVMPWLRALGNLWGQT